MSHVYCPECGFQNPASANYCARCGTLLVRAEEPSDVTQTYTVEELSGEAPPLAELGVEGPALVVRSGGGRAGEHFLASGPRTVIGRSPDCDIFLDDVTVSRRHAVLIDDDGRFSIEDQGSLNGTFVNRARIDKAALEDGDEVQIGKYRMTFSADDLARAQRQAHDRRGVPCAPGGVSRRLDLEDPLPGGQGLLTPRRTQGGYRQFAEEDVERLRTILRLQRDEFLPLRVIRQELSSPTADRQRRRAVALGDNEDEIELDELCRRAGVTPEIVRELEGFGLLEGRGGVYPESDADVAVTCAELARFGLTPRHLRPFRTSAEREVALLEQVAAPGLRARNVERRKRALDELTTLAEHSQHLSELLFARALRRVAAA